MDEHNECLICFDEKHVYKMQTFTVIASDCKCNGLFHASCLCRWVYRNNSCPICRSPSYFNIWLLRRISVFVRNNNINLTFALFVLFNVMREFIKWCIYLLFYIHIMIFIVYFFM